MSVCKEKNIQQVTLKIWIWMICRISTTFKHDTLQFTPLGFTQYIFSYKEQGTGRSYDLCGYIFRLHEYKHAHGSHFVVVWEWSSLAVSFRATSLVVGLPQCQRNNLGYVSIHHSRPFRTPSITRKIKQNKTEYLWVIPWFVRNVADPKHTHTHTLVLGEISTLSIGRHHNH